METWHVAVRVSFFFIFKVHFCLSPSRLISQCACTWINTGTAALIWTASRCSGCQITSDPRQWTWCCSRQCRRVWTAPISPKCCWDACRISQMVERWCEVLGLFFYPRKPQLPVQNPIWQDSCVPSIVQLTVYALVGFSKIQSSKLCMNEIISII